MYENNKPKEYVVLRFGKDAQKKGTEKCHLFEVGKKPIWLPKSQVKTVEDDGDSVIVIVAEWIVEKNDLADHLCPAWIEAGMPAV